MTKTQARVAYNIHRQQHGYRTCNGCPVAQRLYDERLVAS